MHRSSLSVLKSSRLSQRPLVNAGRRWASTENVQDTHSHSSTPPPSAPKSSSPSLSRISPAPRPAPSIGPYSSPPSRSSNPRLNSNRRINDPHFGSVLPTLPAKFGSNQRLNVPDETRARLESIVAQFRAPIRYAFAYGSGVFPQEGYDVSKETPMLDFVFAVTHSDHWHAINMNQFPSHYPSYARLSGPSLISKVQNITPGVWFNAYCVVDGVTIKYGVTTVDNLCSDLLNWDTLYLSGRMHKPIRIIKDEPRVRLTQQVNLVSAIRTALLTLPDTFDENQLFQTICSFSYSGDPRMALPAESRKKIQNIVSKQSPQWKELYTRLVRGMPGVSWAEGSTVIEQDVTMKTKSQHLRRLPKHLRTKVADHYASSSSDLAALLEASDESTFWQKVSTDSSLQSVIQQEMRSIVRKPATYQTLKGLYTGGPFKSVRYSLGKIGKWWRG